MEELNVFLRTQAMTGTSGSGFGSDLHLHISNGPVPSMGAPQLVQFLVGNQNDAPGIIPKNSDGNF